MPAASRIGDKATPHKDYGDQTIQTGSPDVMINGKQAARVGDLLTGHKDSDGDDFHIPEISEGSSSVFINGQPAVRIGDKAECGSMVSEGSRNVFIGDKSSMTFQDGVFVPADPYEYRNAKPIVQLNGVNAVLDDPEGEPLKKSLPPEYPEEEVVQQETEEVESEEEPTEEVPVDCPVVDIANVDYSIRLSQNYTLKSLTLSPVFPHYLREQRGLTASEIVCNLKFLAENAIEPVKAAFPQLNITSCFRVGSGKSDHNIGSAVDLQLYSAGPDFYRQVLDFIDKNIPYTQVIIETSNGGRSYWIHIACRRSGIPSASKKLTYINGSYKPGWHLPR